MAMTDQERRALQTRFRKQYSELLQTNTYGWGLRGSSESDTEIYIVAKNEVALAALEAISDPFEGRIPVRKSIRRPNPAEWNKALTGEPFAAAPTIEPAAAAPTAPSNQRQKPTLRTDTGPLGTVRIFRDPRFDENLA